MSTDKSYPWHDRYSYHGTRVPSWLPVALYEGWEDGVYISLKHEKRLYRYPFWSHWLWKLGRVAARSSLQLGLRSWK